MHCDGEAKPNSRTIELVVQACGSLGAIVAGKCLHGYSIKIGIWRHYTVRSELLSLYCRHGILREADTMFHELSEKDIVSWTAIGWSYARRGLVQETLTLFKSMLQSCIEPDTVFFDSVLTAFSSCGCVHGGKALHAAIIRRDFELDSGVLASLLKMYSNLGQLNVAEAIFAMVGENDEEPWNVMVTSYGRMQLSTYCLGLFRKMQNTAYLVPAEDCLLAVISSCSQGGNFNLAKSVHCFVMKRKAYYSASVLISLVSMYGKLGMLKAAQHIFERTNRDVSAWNNIISAYAKMEQYHEALALFDTMLLENVKPDVVTLKVALSACSSIAALPHGEGIHNYIKANDLINDVDLQTGLVDMYAKCGQLALARELFDSMHEKDTVSWTVMIWGYGTHGYAREALQLFREMEVTGAKPSDVTFLAVLTTCSHSGLVEEGRRIFHKMKDIYLLTPSCRHYTCMVDLLGRSGYLDEAENMILGMPISPDAAVWGALLGTCKMHNNAEIGERAAKRALELDPKNDGYYILLANIYETVGRRCEADTIREMMKNRGIAKAVGWSAA